MRFYSNVIKHIDVHTYFFRFLAIGLIADRLLSPRPIRLYLHPNRTATVLSKSNNKSAVSTALGVN
jgi:hypothetical protein